MKSVKYAPYLLIYLFTYLVILKSIPKILQTNQCFFEDASTQSCFILVHFSAVLMSH